MEANVTAAIAGHPRRAIVGGLLLWLTGMVVMSWMVGRAASP
jgi:hypothetical protein